MRLAIVSDIHGNLTALEAVVRDVGRRGVDEVLHGGDLALIGARPAEVVDRVRELGWSGVVGNTDELLWRPELLADQLAAAPRLEPLLRMLFETYAPVTAERLGDQRLEWLHTLRPELQRGGMTLVHATPRDLWRAPAPSADDAELERAYEALSGDRVVYGHIHRPFVRETASLVVANSGSAGLPWDGDPRASYMLVDGDRMEIVRVPYDVEAEVAALKAGGHPDAERIAAMLREGRFVAIRA